MNAQTNAKHQDKRLRLFVIIAALVVPISYVVGLLRADDPGALWGGIGPDERVWVVPFMFLAAAGFLSYVWITLFGMSSEERKALSWFRQAPDGHGHRRLAIAYGLYLIPSALWLEATLLHLHFQAAWSQWLTILILALVGVGIVLMGLLACSCQGRRMWILIAGTVAMGIQSIVNDLVIWVWKFPW